MLVDRDPEVPARRFSLNYPQYGPSRSPLLNPSSHVIWAAGDRHAQRDFQDGARANWPRYTLQSYTLQRQLLQGPILVLVVEHGRMALDLTSSTNFTKEEDGGRLLLRMDGYIRDKTPNLR